MADRAPYDYEGVVAEGYPLLQKIPDVNEPASGYLWGDLAAHGKTYYHFGEYISSTFCDQPAVADPTLGAMLAGPACARTRRIAPGEALPAEWGGGVNKWPWPIPLLATNIATKPELVGHFAPEAPDFDLLVPDQIRVEIFLRHLKQWIADREQRPRHHAGLCDAAAAQRSHLRHAARRPDTEILRRRQRSRVGPRGGGDLAFALSGTTRPSLSLKTTRRTAPTMWMRTAALLSSSASIRRTVPVTRRLSTAVSIPR